MNKFKCVYLHPELALPFQYHFKPEYIYSDTSANEYGFD